MTLWTATEAAAATGGTLRRRWACGVSIDTRTIQRGDLFVALKDVRDGHDFVAQALEKGAAALGSRIPEGVAEDAPLLIVEDVLDGLEALGVRRARARGARCRRSPALWARPRPRKCCWRCWRTRAAPMHLWTVTTTTGACR